MCSVARLLTSMFARRNCYGTNQSGRDYTFLQSHQCKKCNQHLIGWKQCRLLHSCVTIKSFVWTLVTIQQLTTNYQQYNTYYDILRLHEKLKNRCLRFINCIGTSNTKSMLIINFPLYWSQSSFCHEMNWVVHRSFCYHVFLGVHVHSTVTAFQIVHCCCEPTILYSVSLGFLYSLMHELYVCP